MAKATMWNKMLNQSAESSAVPDQFFFFNLGVMGTLENMLRLRSTLIVSDFLFRLKVGPRLTGKEKEIFLQQKQMPIPFSLVLSASDPSQLFELSKTATSLFKESYENISSSVDCDLKINIDLYKTFKAKLNAAKLIILTHRKINNQKGWTGIEKDWKDLELGLDGKIAKNTKHSKIEELVREFNTEKKTQEEIGRTI